MAYEFLDGSFAYLELTSILWLKVCEEIVLIIFLNITYGKIAVRIILMRSLAIR